ncbi:MAG: hypothetical protein GYB68_06130 [Chloroflexi bacterium]|nr:hypothetical protein [Chloroflexota bacterium]
MIIVRIIGFVVGAMLGIMTILAALRTVVMPRAENVWLTRWLFQLLRVGLFDMLVARAESYQDRDRLMAYFAPLGVFLLPTAWLTSLSVSYALMFWGIGHGTLFESFVQSGSSMLTLGYRPVETLPEVLLSFTASGLGLILITLMISYLPAMYSAFSKREEAVARLEVRAGDPPTSWEMLLRYHNLGRLDRLDEIWERWERWFVELAETHTSLAPLVHFRSPEPHHSWVTASGAVLDAAVLRASVLDLPRSVDAEVMIRAGYIALRRIASFFNLPFDPLPAGDDPISIDQREFDAIYDQLKEAGLPIKPDREQAWREFSGWRVNYDQVLIGLAALTMAPYAPWSSDRSFVQPRYFNRIPRDTA